MRLIVMFLIGATVSGAQSSVELRVDGQSRGAFKPIYQYVGYDEANYTYANNGRKLLHELGAASEQPVYVRTHFLLATGDGTPGLKWSSTNAYTEDASGRPVYDWTTIDRIFQTYLEAGAKPFVEIGFMPQALSLKPGPYRPEWIPGAKNEHYMSGWTYPPKDYAKWAALIRAWVEHEVSKYGKAEVTSWYWEVWNEPNIGYWHGTPEEYDKLYDFTVEAVKSVLPSARVGGPATTGPASQRAADFLRQFLEHCSSGTNFATGKAGSPLDFISYHAKGRPQVVDGRVRMGLAEEMLDADRGFEIIGSFAKYRGLPIILSEADPEGCAACSARVYPPNAYRNGTLYPAYTAAALKTLMDEANRRGANLEGMLTWAFEFENQPYFDGFRTLATNGIDKPILNFFRMAGLLRGDSLEAASSGSPKVDLLATRSARNISVLAWNYQDDDVSGEPAAVDLTISGLPENVRRVLLHHYRIDHDHSNAYTAWKEMGAPQQPTAEQYARLEAAGQLQLLESPRWIDAVHGSAHVRFSLPLEAVSFVGLEF